MRWFRSKEPERSGPTDEQIRERYTHIAELEGQTDQALIEKVIQGVIKGSRSLFDDHAIAGLEQRTKFNAEQALVTDRLLRHVQYPPHSVKEDEEPAPLDFEQARTSSSLYTDNPYLPKLNDEGQF